MTAGLTERDYHGVTAENAVTVGQRLFVLHGITGARGQAEAGFPAVTEIGLRVLEQGVARGLSLNDAGCGALLAILASTTDTNMIARSDLQTQHTVSAQIAKLLQKEPYPGKETLEKLDDWFIQKNLSPGGSADLLAATYFLYFVTR
jgi:triphosphoribosyl-dephospho-CoA synthetase